MKKSKGTGSELVDNHMKKKSKNVLITPHQVERILTWASLIRGMPDRRWTKWDDKFIKDVTTSLNNFYRVKNKNNHEIKLKKCLN